MRKLLIVLLLAGGLYTSNNDYQSSNNKIIVFNTVIRLEEDFSLSVYKATFKDKVSAGRLSSNVEIRRK